MKRARADRIGQTYGNCHEVLFFELLCLDDEVNDEAKKKSQSCLPIFSVCYFFYPGKYGKPNAVCCKNEPEMVNMVSFFTLKAKYNCIEIETAVQYISWS